MNLTIQRADLARALASVSRVVERRNTIPILACVLLDAEADTLTVRATDLDMEMSVKVPATVIEQGVAAVDAIKLADIAKRVTGEAITMALDDGRLTVKCGRSRVSLPVADAGDYPKLNVGDFTAEFEMDLAALVASVAYAQSDEQTRYYLCGTYLHLSMDGDLIAVASDGHRLAKRTGSGVGAFPPSIVPKKAIAAMPKGEAAVALSSSKIRVEAGDTVLVSKLIDGTYPDYQRVVPVGNPHRLLVSKAALTKAAELAMSVSDMKSRCVRLDIAPGSVAVSSRGASGDASQELEAQYSGEPMSVGVNGQYLVDTLAAFSCDEVEMAFADPGSPILFCGSGDLTAVCMPMRT